MHNFQRGRDGFSIWFAHAGVSVQFGAGYHGSHYDMDLLADRPQHLEAGTAEVMIRSTGRDAEAITQEWNPDAHGGILGYATPLQVADAIAWAAAYVPNAAGLAPTLGSK